MSLPQFKYHPDPIATGSIEASDAKCVCCGKARGFIYTGPVFTIEELDQNQLCPWCIADGSAHKKFDASFTDSEGVGCYGRADKVPIEVIEEIAFRTPGFAGWQQERWWTHCGDAAEFLGPAGHTEIKKWGNELAAELRKAAGISKESDWITYFQALDKDRSPTAYAFRCRHCGKLGGYSDCD